MTTAHQAPAGTATRVAAPMIVFAVVLAAALIGIGTRMALPLANFWPANALLLGIFVRWPSLRTSLSWLAAIAAYLTADLVTGGSLAPTVWLTIANLTGVLVGVSLYDRAHPADRLLARPESLLLMLGISMAAALAAAIPGTYCGTRYFAMSVGSAALTWSTTELAGFLGILPMVLSFPVPAASARSRSHRPTRSTLSALADRYGPPIAVAASLLLGIVVDGPGALAVCVPALLWSALRCSFFETACLVFVATSWNLLALGLDLFSYFDYDTLDSQVKISLQSGLALMSLGPLMVAASTRARDQSYREVIERVTRDELTGALIRRTFTDQARRVVDDAGRTQRQLAVLMIDVDHFKAVNDTYGHVVGDQVLRAVAGAIRTNLRDTDTFGRYGGEEFAAVIPGVSRPTAEAIAHAIRQAVGQLEVQAPGSDGSIRVTTSVGVVHIGTSVPSLPSDPAATLTDRADPPSLDHLLAAADRALYAAKRDGRNTVCVGQIAPTAGVDPGDDVPSAG